MLLLLLWTDAGHGADMSSSSMPKYVFNVSKLEMTPHQLTNPRAASAKRETTAVTCRCSRPRPRNDHDHENVWRLQLQPWRRRPLCPRYPSARQPQHCCGRLLRSRRMEKTKGQRGESADCKYVRNATYTPRWIGGYYIVPAEDRGETKERNSVRRFCPPPLPALTCMCVGVVMDRP